MSITPEQASMFQDAFGRLVANVENVLVGKTFVIRLGFVALLSEGHLLLEDYPGTGKTSFARAIAQSVQGSVSRIQFTPDLLPGDITGVSVFDQSRGEFSFHGGPVFSNIVLADEINRASPKTQAALLEVMEEHRVTVDGVRYGPIKAVFDRAQGNEQRVRMQRDGPHSRRKLERPGLDHDRGPGALLSRGGVGVQTRAPRCARLRGGFALGGRRVRRRGRSPRIGGLGPRAARPGASSVVTAAEEHQRAHHRHPPHRHRSMVRRTARSGQA